MLDGKSKPKIDQMEKNGDIEGLISALKFEDCNIRKEAIVALKKIGDNRALYPLIQALEYKNWHNSYAVMGSVRENAAEALGSLKDKRAVEPLIASLNDEDEEVRWKAAWALGNIGDKRAVAPLIYSLDDGSWSVRKSAISALGNIGDRQAVENLIQALSDDDWHVRKYAADALGNIGDKRAIKPLVETLSDNDEDVKRKAVVALGKMKSAALEPLIEAFKDDDWRIRGKIAEILGNIGDERAVTPLINALIGRSKDGTKHVRGRAAEALGKIGDEKSIEYLIKALDDGHTSVRIKAKEALAKIESATRIECYDNGEIIFDYPGSWEVISTSSKKKIVKGNFTDGDITFSINKNINLSDLTSREFVNTIKEVFTIQNGRIISEVEFKKDGIDVHNIIGEDLNSVPPTKIMITAFKIDDLLYYFWFAGRHEIFKKAEKDIDLIVNSFKVYM